MLKLRDGSFGSYRGGRGASAVTPATATGLRIHWDRMALAAAGVIALLAALVTGVVALVTTLPLAVPVVLFLLFVGTVVGLRSLAVRDRRRRLDAAFDEVLDARDEHRYVIDDVDRDTLLFDAASVELFADGGLTTMTEIFFPQQPFTQLKLRSTAGLTVDALTYAKVGSMVK